MKSPTKKIEPQGQLMQDGPHRIDDTGQRVEQRLMMESKKKSRPSDAFVTKKRAYKESPR